MWLFMAILSAFFAGVAAILVKCGIKHTDSDIANALRTMAILIFAWLIVYFVEDIHSFNNINESALFFLILSGIATGIAWLCYFKALSMGDINKVVPIDKSSVVLSVLLAIIIFHEYIYFEAKIICIIIIFIGTLLMVDLKNSKEKAISQKYIIYAVLSAVFSALTSILAKFGVADISTNLATAIRTIVIFLISWLIVIYQGKMSLIKAISHKEMCFIILSGITTTLSWICYYYALKYGVVSIVVPIDKLSIVITILFSWLIFKEKLNLKTGIGLILIVSATIIISFLK